MSAARSEPVLSERLDELAGRLAERLVAARREEVVAGSELLPLGERIGRLVEEEATMLSPESRALLAERVARETVGLGPLEELLADPAVEEILVNGPADVWVERAGRLRRSEVGFAGDEHLRDVIERVLGPIGRRVDELSPMADGRLPDGSRVNVVIPPLAVDGPLLSIRRFAAVRPGAAELERLGTIPAEPMAILREAVGEARNVLVSGGTASGKTTVLNALSAFIGAGERVITIEDAAELQLRQPHVVRLESRPPSIEGGGEVTIRDLVRNALRMRPDRIIVGEVRGGEAMDLLIALNTGHRGALSTVHANSPVDALRRIELLAMMSGLEVPFELVRSQLAGALDVVLHLERGRDGRRRATALVDVVETPGGAGVRELWCR